MKTNDLFKVNRSSKRLNESLSKIFGTSLKLENFDTTQLEDARNKLRTQISQVRGESSFNENIENDALTQAQFMLDAINAEIIERAEHVVESITDKEVDEYFFFDFPEKQDGKEEDDEEDTETKESAPPTAKGERTVKHIKAAYSKDGKLTDKEKSIAYATAWKQHNNESIEQTGDNMRNLREGEIQQASAIVTAKTMVDRVGRWIEELSGMENDTLLQLGDSIRDEMGQEAAKQFISACAPAIQAALENLKSTREALSSSVRGLTGEEQPANMLGGEPPAGDMGGEPDIFGGEEEGGLDAAGPDAMNGGDEFGAADAAVGGIETAGREQRESINYQTRLLKVLAG